ncbi:MAG: hypothetical protein HS113_28960 [Verrucomicrobiales bacterium]|nr:hypothetical protein [Verrucomicrobiales bacterium]
MPSGGELRCTGAGTPGTWLQIWPAAVTADPSSGTIPSGYLILNVTTGHIKRHAGSYSGEITVGAGTSAKVGLHGATPTAQRVNANQANATDFGSVIVLANELCAAFVDKGLINGGA